MFQKKEAALIQIYRLMDLLITVIAFYLAYYIRVHLPHQYFTVLKTGLDYKFVFLLIIIIWYLVFEKFQLYTSFKEYKFSAVLWRISKAVSIAMLTLIFFLYVFRITTMSRLLMALFFVLDICLIGAGKFLTYYLIDWFGQRELNIRKVIVVGSRERAKEVIHVIQQHDTEKISIQGCLEIDESYLGKQVTENVHVFDIIGNLDKILSENIVDEIIFAIPLKDVKNVNHYINLAEMMGISVRIIPDFQIHHLMTKLGIGTLKLENFKGILTMSLHTTPANYGMLIVKEAFDYIFAATAMIFFFPLFCLIGVIIKLVSPGAVLFTQIRCGLNGRKFTLYKFRTMVADAEDKQNELKVINEAEEPVFKVKKDPRIIPFIGTILRKTNLDEMPQLINVLKGEMSLVGPRPPIPNEVEKYELWQRRRLSMKPGMTCIWQIKPKRNETSFHEWMDLDLTYIDNWSIVLDFKILLATVRTVLTGSGR
jgi:exopolysaccharide biosynthesis polyprenyl glycosylphosphotransferase